MWIHLSKILISNIVNVKNICKLRKTKCKNLYVIWEVLRKKNIYAGQLKPLIKFSSKHTGISNTAMIIIEIWNIILI